MRVRATINVVFSLLVVASLLAGPSFSCALCVKPPAHPCCPKTPAKSPGDCGQTAACMVAPAAIQQADPDILITAIPALVAAPIPEPTWDASASEHGPALHPDTGLACRQLRL